MDRLERQFIDVYDRYADAIFRYCLYRSYEREKAKDFTQETFMRFWNLLTKGEVIEKPQAMLYTIARNLIIDSSRKRFEPSLDALVESGWQIADHHDGEAQRHLVLDIRHSLRQLRVHNGDWCECVELKYLDGLPVKEIARLLDVSPGTVSVRIYRGIRYLKKSLRYEAQT
ncbi:MAG: hypothetical protein A3J59_04740 [Candidatus Buchananbacteria bacterium RIFCSPHIGHO2_02_FULL_56_16]|uniref:HTH luxR-type domain-containing protein n=1 Tax=Candidatus Buchananbacteria bacterium RIFCSPHIGHO2_02_FULL_56_16 TaxID=1797542 RepID=A0A1G1YCL4_9BACT|nr:MAG: hypothetical protein A3J59_04740 [Candidatus Buchananbacteria bacterium RIFCSPHIGHO2_02_FULL_56_16]